MIEKFINSLYTKVFINIIVGRTQSEVYVEINSAKGLEDSCKMSFDTTGLNVKMYEFIDEYVKTSPYFYISILDYSTNQGAVSSQNKQQLEGSYRFISFDYWDSYIPQDDLNLMQNEYKSIGLDFVFSPFTILSKFFADKIEGDLAMYILVEESRMALAVFDKSQLLYANYIDIESEDDDSLMMDSSLDGDEDPLSDLDGVEEIDLDDLESEGEVDDFGDIEDLDSGDDIEEFAEAQEIEEIDAEGEDADEEDEAFGFDYKRFLQIHHSVRAFYASDKYNSDFIENIYIADGVGVSKELSRYLKEELFFHAIVRKIDLNLELCDLAKVELA